MVIGFRIGCEAENVDMAKNIVRIMKVIEFPKGENNDDFFKDVEMKMDNFSGFDKVIVIGLNDKDGKYNIKIMSKDMRSSECLSLLEIAKGEIKREMNY